MPKCQMATAISDYQIIIKRVEGGTQQLLLKCLITAKKRKMFLFSINLIWIIKDAPYEHTVPNIVLQKRKKN